MSNIVLFYARGRRLFVFTEWRPEAYNALGELLAVLDSMAIRRTLYLIPTLVAALILAWPVLLHAENAIRYTDATGQPGDIVEIDMIMENDVVISGGAIPFRWSSPDVSLIEVEILRDRFNGVISQSQIVLNAEERTSGVFFVRGTGIFEQGWVDPGSGVLAHLRFLVAPGAPDQVVYVDSVFRDLGSGNFEQSQYSNFQGTQVIFPNVYAGQIVVGSPGLDIVMETSPGDMRFEGMESGFDPPTQTLSIESTSGSRYNWEATWNSNWLTMIPASGSAPSFVSVRPDIRGLSEGTYVDTITVSSVTAANSPIRVPVELVVSPLQVQLESNPAGLDLEAHRPGSDSLREVIAITANAAVAVEWFASNGAPWLTLTEASGTTPGILVASIDLRDSAFGEYHDTINVVSDVAVNSPLRIPVAVSLDSVGIQLNISPNPLELKRKSPRASQASGMIALSTTPAVPIEWFATWYNDWLTLSEVSGTTPWTMEATANIERLLAGKYTDSIVFTSQTAENSPMILAVEMTVHGFDEFDDLGIPRILVQNYPNPLNLYRDPKTTITFYLDEPDRVEIEVFNTLGQRVSTLLSEQRGSGTQSIEWDGRDLNGNYVSSGHYFYRMTTSKGTVTKRMTVIK